MKHATRCSTFILAIALTFANPSPSHAQSGRDQDLEAVPVFFADAVAYASGQPGKARVDVYVQIPYEELTFVKEGEQFVARYVVTLSFLTHEQKPVLDRTWTEVVRVTDHAQTTSSRFYSLGHRGIDLDPGNYVLNVLFRDEDSRKTSRLRRSLLVSDFEKNNLSLSDIMLVNRLSTDGEKRSIVPNISGNVGHLSEGFFLFVELYSKTDIDSVDLTWKVFDAKQKELMTGKQLEALTGATTQSFLKIDNPALPAGIYYLTVRATELGKSDTLLTSTTSRTFTVRWSDLPHTIRDLDKAIDQMRYIARESEMQYMRDAEDANEKRRRFLEYWKKRDPDPSTERNELMEEYFARVEFANKNFSHYNEGWRTDRGMVHIYLGPPESIERRPFDLGSKPYEIWSYYNLNRDFVFVDETGFGDYRLRSPLSEFWSRVR
jgi:GWxTD domain-containing protein